ncbi:MAG: hypothetical protein EAZ97_07030 [Bacteroidetes bacterium]|nr:MAG: hypothetical protein EAZ97_07030 [Bacteroidota bacterium]
MLKRAEIPFSKVVGANYSLVHSSEKGILLMLESQETELTSTEKEIIFSKYDSALNPIWTATISVGYLAIMQKHCLDGDDLFFLIKNKKNDYNIIKINLQNGLISLLNYKKLLEIDISHFEVANGILFLGGTVDNMTVVLQYDYKNSRSPKVLPSIWQEKVSLNTLIVDQKKESVLVITSEKSNSNSDLFFYSYDLNGKLLNKWVKKGNNEHSFLAFKTFVPNSEELYLFGTYALGKRDKAQGFYVSRFSNAEENFTYFYDFSSLNNFFNHLGEKGKEKLLEKVKNKEQKGKVFIHEEDVFLHDLEIKEDRIYLTAELYVTDLAGYELNPAQTMQRTINESKMSGADRFYKTLGMDQHQKAIYEGKALYAYKSAVICGFDKTGKLLWDNDFDYQKLKYVELSPVLQNIFSQDSITMLHWQDQNLLLKRSYGNFTLDSLQKFEPKLLDKHERVEYAEREKIIFWYKNYFLIYGFHEITDKENKRRKVFYLVKIGKTNAKKEEK